MLEWMATRYMSISSFPFCFHRFHNDVSIYMISNDQNTTQARICHGLLIKQERCFQCQYLYKCGCCGIATDHLLRAPAIVLLKLFLTESFTASGVPAEIDSISFRSFFMVVAAR